MSVCEKHGYDLRYIKECTGCVREERDRYRKALLEIKEALYRSNQESTYAFEVVEKAIDRRPE